MKNWFKFLIPLTVILSLNTNIGNSIVQLPDENKISTQNVDRLQKIKEKGVLTILSSNNEPYSYKNPRTGEFSGIDADIIREVAKRLGVNKVEARYTLFSNLFEDLVKSSDIDMIVDGITITDERKRLVDFTIPIYDARDGILTRKDTNINSKDDLKNLIIGVNKGEVYEDIVKNWKEQGFIKNYLIFDNRDSLRIGLQNKTIDAILAAITIEQNIVQKNPKSNFKILSPTQYKSEKVATVGYPLKKEDTTLLNAINEKLQEMKNDGTLYQILTKYGIRDHYIP
ncbi:transporter substrate-binding domain-containing protein [Clostridium sp. SHJSY1]|uniref:substrate-binding periplasmic protein n=1 Tax=Clostridium sp. SHJSY1 TaxID=2942483 RepID=UPI002874A154|nr:transporter substrate-binding domain-containing protein [Clostridium sp. SHJSY1]MDS0524379.1 transporter substrate-binding domain-containing protein [Clostridium sp. SHJSY1]